MALAVISLVLVTAKFLNIKPDFGFIIFVFCSTIVAYNFIKYGVEARKYLQLSNRYHRSIQIFSFINLMAALFYVPQLTISSWIVLGITCLFIAAYAIPVYPRLKNLRNYGLLKVFLVALVWTLITSVLPMVQHGVQLQWDVYVDWVQRFLLILVLMVPFEIRDLKFDPPELRTIPQRIGVGATKWAGSILALGFFLMTFLKDDLHPVELISNGILMVLLAFALGFSGSRQSRYYASFWVEGVPVLWAGMVLALDSYWTYS